MHHAQLTDLVRRQVTNAFADLGAASGALRETILIRDGGYCGRRFESDEAAAVWFVEENQLKVYRADGSVASVVPVGTMLALRRAA
jgi:hypothetical protein